MEIKNPVRNWIKQFLLKGLKTKITIIIIGAISMSFVLFFISPIKGQVTNELNFNELILLTNKERAKYFLPSLSINPLLNQSALNKAEDILKNNYFNHNSPDGKKFSSWVQEMGYTYSVVGENLAEGFISNEAIISAWMKSAKHRDNILNPKYQDIGIAILEGKLNGVKTNVIVQYFGLNKNITTLSENFIKSEFIYL